MPNEPESCPPEQELRLSKAPIVEAALSIEYGKLDEEELLQFSTVCDMLRIKYGRQEPIVQREVSVEMPVGPIRDETTVGRRLLSSDGHYAVQLRVDAFIFSRLAPYESWNSFRDEARIAWNAFRTVLTSLQLKTLGIRYINKISFPVREPIERYLRIYAVVPDSLTGGSQEVNEGYLRIQIPLETPRGKLVVQVIHLPSEEEGVATLALDNDFRFEFSGVEDSQIWNLFEEARRMKNLYFRHFITNELLESYR